MFYERSSMYDFIINLLDLKPEDILDLYKEDSSSSITFHLTLKRSPSLCPSCFHLTDSIKDYYLKSYHHGILNGLDTIIVYHCRRYKCSHCGRTFKEKSSLGNQYFSITPTTVISILNQLKHYTATYSEVARRHHVSISTVVSIFDNHVQIKRHKLSTVLCIDEIYFNRHSQYKYAFVIMDFKTKRILDMVESRKMRQLSDYFFKIPIQERKQVQYICMDMYVPYKQIVMRFFPMATICIDSFHVIKKITDALNAVRKRVMRQYQHNKDSKEYRLLKYRYKLLLKNGEHINTTKYFFDHILGYTTTEANVLHILLNIHKDLRVAYELKEDYQLFNSCLKEEFEYMGYQKELNALITSMKKTEIKEFVEVSKTLKNWEKEILNSFHWFDKRRISNGCIEGKNNYIKKILSNANGMRNFERARNRIMYSQNLYDTYTISVHEHKIKKPGNFRGKYQKK